MRNLSSQVRVVADTACAIGENPLWHADQECLYFCDIPAGRIYRYDPLTKKTKNVIDGRGEPARMIGGFTIEADGALLLFMSSGRIERWKDGRSDVVIECHPDIAATRFNDVIADPAGRVLCGTMSSEKLAGKLYLLDLDRTLTPVVEDVGCSNGLAFTLDRTRLYHTDSFARTISLFDYHDGDLSNQRLFTKTRPSDGLPDGMTVDSEDHVWSALWGARAIIRFAPSGEEVCRVGVPVSKVSSLTFGGPNLQTLFITTAGGDVSSTADSSAGSVFAIEPGVCGVAEFRSRICTQQR